MQSAQQAVHPWFVSYPGVGTGSHKQLSLSTLVLEVSLSIATEDCNFLVHRRSMKSKWRDSVNNVTATIRQHGADFPSLTKPKRSAGWFL